MTVTVRHERSADHAAIAQVIERAFAAAPHASGAEARIVNDLRQAQALTLSLVAERDGAVVGYVALSPVKVSDGTTRWYGLGPIAVDPDCQRTGIASRLMTAAIEELRILGAAGCVLLGDPGFYVRFGFRSLPGLTLPGVPPEYFQALAFGTCCPQGTVSYHPAFGSGRSNGDPASASEPEPAPA
ncbi:GNAT family N-acetyltransferase [Elongatibacter sediminis]|uniref:N-acetyltransferase n=1 Tax=Elongatibacter sediminis TaxID=3119006 RepID=A0AAW9RIX5_9GAMM